MIWEMSGCFCAPPAVADSTMNAFLAGLMNRMTLAEKVGQLVAARLPVTAVFFPKMLRPVGLVFHGWNFIGRDKVPGQKWYASSAWAMTSENGST
jgi:hypothetical protein